MNRDELVRSQSVQLPDIVRRRRDSGDLEGAIRAADALLTDPDLPRMLRARLLVEKERIRRLPEQFPDDRETAFRKLRARIPDLTEAEFEEMEDRNVFHWIMLQGEKRYFVRNTQLALRRPALTARSENPAKPENPWLDPMIEEIRSRGILRRRYTVDATLQLRSGFEPGTYRAWLPYPACSAQQSDISLLAGDPDFIAPPDAPARTAFWQRKLDRWEDFHLRYAFTSVIRYADPLQAPAPSEPLYPDALPISAEDLAEDPPFIRFTPCLRSLAEELASGENDPVRKAWRFYEFITTRVMYSFMAEYFAVDDLGEYCAFNLKGDCGLQALLFISLCRLSGIPARWQSGVSIDADYIGSHDWAQFWVPGWGWLFADPSYGGSAWQRGALGRHAFYFGNLDPARIAANRIFEAELSPAGDALRVDPYDNQTGELERVGAILPFQNSDLHTEYKLLSAENL